MPRLTDEELTALVRACEGPAFVDRRDEAMVRLMTEGLMRAGEPLALGVAEWNQARLASVRRWQGRPGPGGPVRPGDRAGARQVPTDAAPPPAGAHGRRYGCRPRAGRRSGTRGRAATSGPGRRRPGSRGSTFTGCGTPGSRWLRAGGTPTALRTVGGWAELAMVPRYTEDDAAGQAIEESRRLGPGPARLSQAARRPTTGHSRLSALLSRHPA